MLSREVEGAPSLEMVKARPEGTQQPGLVKGDPAHDSRVGLAGLQRSLPSQPHL